jgi:hypothetical protein
MKHRKFNLIFFASVIFVFSFGNVVSSQIKTAAIPVPFSTLALAFDGTEKELYRSVDITLKLWLGSLDVNDPERLWAIEHNIQWLIRGEPHNLLEGYEHEKKQDSDDDFNDDFLEEYRKRRLEELKGAEIAGRYTYVKQITKEDFRIEVTDAPKGLWVVLLLY